MNDYDYALTSETYRQNYSYTENYYDPAKNEFNIEERREIKTQSSIARIMQSICCYTGIGKGRKKSI